MKIFTKNKWRSIFTQKDRKDISLKALSFFVFRVFGLLLGYCFTVLVTRFFGAETWGLIALAFTFFLFVPILGRMGVDMYFVKFFSEKKNIAQHAGLFYKALLLSFVIASLLSFVLLLNKEVLAEQLFHKVKLAPYLYWVFLSLPFWTVTLVCAAIPRAQKQNNWYAFLDNPGRYFLTLVAFFPLYLLQEDPIVAIKAHFFAIVGLSLLAFYRTLAVFKNISFHSTGSLKSTLKESYPMMIATSGIVLLGTLDTFFMGIYRPEEEVGVYNVVLKVSMLTQISLQAINSIMAPKVAEFFHQNKMQEMRKMIAFATRLNSIISLFIILVLLFANKLILGIFGEVFKTGTWILIILCVGQLISAFSGSVGVILQMTGRQKVHQNLIVISVVINIILNVLLIPEYGSIGAAIATTISLSLWNILGAIYLKKKAGIKSYHLFVEGGKINI